METFFSKAELCVTVVHRFIFYLVRDRTRRTLEAHTLQLGNTLSIQRQATCFCKNK